MSYVLYWLNMLMASETTKASCKNPATHAKFTLHFP